MLTRQCTKDYKLQNPNLVIEKGVPILISILALHHDPKYWNDPYTFNPDRFNGDSKSFTIFGKAIFPVWRRSEELHWSSIGKDANESRIGADATKISF